MNTYKNSRMTAIGTVLMAACAFGSVASATTLNGAVGSQLQGAAARAALVNNLSQNLQIFAVAAQKYVFENTGSVPWNQNQSTTPVGYAPFLLYAGANSSACGSAGGSGTAVPGFTSPVNISGTVTDQSMANPVSGWTAPTDYLPSQWHPALGGTYCAVVTLNDPAAKQVALVAYYVAPNGAISHKLNIQMAPSSAAFSGSVAVQSSLPTGSTWKPMWKPTGSSTWQ